MAINEIPTGVLPELIVDALPKTGEENKVYRVLIDPNDESQMTNDYIWYDNAFHPFSFEAKVFGAYFQKYQSEVSATITEMETVIEEQAQKILELEEEVFPTEQTSFEMMMSSLIDTELDLYDHNDEVIPNQGLYVEYSDDPYELVYQNEVKKGTYYLKNEDGYALGKADGSLQPLVCEGGTVNLGNVEIIMSLEGGGDGMEDGGDL